MIKQGSDTSNSTLQDDFPSFSPLVRSVLQPLQEAVKRVQKPLRRVKMEVAALADTAMTAALLQVINPEKFSGNIHTKPNQTKPHHTTPHLTTFLLCAISVHALTLGHTVRCVA